MVSCEHGGNEIPAPYTSLFPKAGSLLASHRGYDPGALELAEKIAEILGAPLFSSTTTRLLIDANRSSTSKNLFSSVTKNLTSREKKQIIKAYHAPYRSAIKLHIQKRISENALVLHLSIHSFTPVLKGTLRTADIGLLYDPARVPETDFCIRLGQNLVRRDPALKVRRNYPYRGTANGLTTHLRTQFSAKHYLGVEMEINQKFPLGSRSCWNRLQGNCMVALKRTLESLSDGKYDGE